MKPDLTTKFPKDWLSHHSLFFKNFFTHAFLHELTVAMLLAEHPRMLNILRAEVDSVGVDLVLTCDHTVRHVQLKALGKDSSPNEYRIPAMLAEVRGGCVVWLCYDQATLDIKHYHVLAATPGKRLESLLPRRTARRKENGETVEKPGDVWVKTTQANHKTVSTQEMAVILFGEESSLMT